MPIYPTTERKIYKCPWCGHELSLLANSQWYDKCLCGKRYAVEATFSIRKA